jgi:hypothetical protein
VTLDRTLELYKQVAPRVERAIVNSVTFLDGYPTGSSASGSDNEGGRTAIVATSHVEKGDKHGHLKAELDKCIAQLADIVDKLAPSNKAADHMASQASDQCPPGYCESCFRDNGHHTPSKNPGGRMCKWCQNLARTLTVDLPPIVLVQRHNRGQRITDRDVRTATGGKA